MKNILKIFTSDIKNILKNKIALIIICGLLVLPSLYAWFNIYASWNPYKNTNGIKIAVCNKDLGAKIRDVDINIGSQVQKTLKKNKALGWTFVDNVDEAIDLADKGEVYASIIIPKDFSAKISTILSDNPIKPTLEYYVNEKINAISPKITDKGASTIQISIGTSFVESVTEQVISAMEKAGVETTNVKPLLSLQKENLESLIKSIPIMSERLKNSSLSVKQGSKVIKFSSKDIDYINKVSTDLISFTNNLRKNIDIINDNTGGVSNNIIENINFVQVSIKDLDDNIVNLKEKIVLEKPDFVDDLNEKSANVEKAVKQMSSIQNNIKGFDKDISHQIKILCNTTDDQLYELQDLLHKLNSANLNDKSIHNTTKLIRELDFKIKPNLSNLRNILQIYSKLNSNANNAINQINETISLVNSINDETIEIDKATDKFVNSIQYYLKYSERDIKEIRESFDRIDELVRSENSYLTASITEVSDICLSRMNEISKVISSLAYNMSNTDSIEKYLDTAHNLNVNMIGNIDNLLMKINTDLAPAIKRYLLGVSNFSSDINTLLVNTNKQSKFLKDFLNKLSVNGQVTSEDMIKLSENLPKIQNELVLIDNKINDFIEKINFNKFVDRVENNKSTIANFMASPVELETHALYHMKNYGCSMTPFYTTLALWVGVLILASLLTTETKNVDFKPTHVQAYLGKLMLFSSLAAIQALIVSLGDIYLLGVTASDTALFIEINIFLSLIFCSIVYTLVYLFGNVGKAMSVILLVLQVAGSGGTFPIQMTPPLFRKLYVWLPFTYGIAASREAIAGVVYSALKKDIHILTLYMVVSLTIGILLVNTTHKYLEKLSHKLKESGVTE